MPALYQAKYGAKKKLRKDFTNAKGHTITPRMNMERRCILLFAPVAFAMASWLPNQLNAAELQEAKVTQVVQDVKVVPAGAAPRAATVNETVHQGHSVQTGVQSRSELTFKDQTITRLGEQTIYNVGGGRTLELGTGQFLLYVPKKSGGAKIKMGAVTAAITGTTVVGNVHPSGVVEFTVLEGTARVRLDRAGQCLLVVAGQMVVYDPIGMRLEDPVEVDLQQQLSSPLVTGFRPLPSTPDINVAIANQRRAAAGTGGAELAAAVSAAGAASVDSATPDQFMQAFSSLLVRYPQAEICDVVATAVRLRPDLADRIVVAAVTTGRPVRGYSKDYKQPVGKEMPCDWVQCIIDAAIAVVPRMADQIINAVITAAPMLRDCIGEPCFPANEFIPPHIIAPINPQNFRPVSPEQPPN
jgi:FecR protein